jgi:hypothetical protein
VLIALLVVLGVDLTVIVAVLAVVLARKGPFLFRNELVAANATAGPRDASSGEVKRLGKHPEIVGLEADGDARITIGVASNRGKAPGPFAAAGGKTSVAE